MYEGNFVDNNRHGDGNFFSADGAEYRGRWINDKQDGQATEVWPTGAYYEG